MPSANTCTADLAADSTYFAGLLDLLRGGQGSMAELHCLHIPFAAEHDQLHAVVKALYTGVLFVKPETVEALLRIADFLGIACISDACQSFVKRLIVSECPMEVAASLLV